MGCCQKEPPSYRPVPPRNELRIVAKLYRDTFRTELGWVNIAAFDAAMNNLAWGWSFQKRAWDEVAHQHVMDEACSVAIYELMRESTATLRGVDGWVEAPKGGWLNGVDTIEEWLAQTEFEMGPIDAVIAMKLNALLKNSSASLAAWLLLRA